MNFILIGYLSNAEMAKKTLCQQKTKKKKEKKKEKKAKLVYEVKQQK